VHARHNVIIASLGGGALLTLSIYSLWAMRRAARVRVQQLEIEHLAQLGKMEAASKPGSLKEGAAAGANAAGAGNNILWLRDQKGTLINAGVR
jgi:hypothetical protein